MRNAILLFFLCGAISGCGRNETDPGTVQGASGSGTNYSRGGTKDDHQRAMDTATDTRPRGGSMQGAGGIGPGYDGSGQGEGRHGTVPPPGAGFAGGLTNSTNARSKAPAPQTR